MANSEAVSYGRAVAEEALAYPYTPVEHRLANTYRSMQVVGDPPTVFARINGLATRTVAD